MWKFKRKKYSKPGQDYYSISNKLKSEAKIKYAHSACRTKNEAAAMLGINKVELRKLLKQYNTENWFIKD